MVARGADPLQALRALFVGRPDALADVVRRLDRAAGTDQPVLVTGEPGAGRAVVARAFHHADRGDRPLVEHEGGGAAPLDAALDAAGEGALLLRDVELLGRDAQSELLARLRDAPGLPRVYATTRHDLRRAAATGWFLAELADRLAVIRVAVPPLRATPACVAPLVAACFEAAGADARDLDALDLSLLVAHSWPGNVAEVARVSEALVRWSASEPLGPRLLERALAQVARAAPAGAPLDGTLVEVERSVLAARLTACDWHQGRTAESLGIDRKTLYRKIRRYGLTPPAPEEAP